MHGPRDDHTKWSEAHRETYIPNNIIQTWNLRYDTNEPNWLDLIGIKRTFHAKAMNFTFFSNVHETFSRIDHILGHKSSLGKLKAKTNKQKNQNHFKHLFWLQCSQIRCQLQGERNYYKYRHMEGKQHASEWPKYKRKKSDNKWKYA